PKREIASGVFQKYRNEAFHRTKWRPVNHHRTVQFVIRSFIGKVESLRQVVIHLNGSQLPLATQRVLHHEVEFRSVESCFSIFDYGIQTFVASRIDDRIFCFFPVFLATYIFIAVLFVAERYLSGEIFKSKRTEYIKHQIDYLLELVIELLRSTENVRVILGKTANACQSVKFTRLLVTVHGSELGITLWKVFVRPRFVVVDLAVVRTVHRFQQKLLTLGRSVDRLETVGSVFRI